MWYVYIVLASNGSLYTGSTTDIKRRLEEHIASKKGAKYLRGKAPLTLVFSEQHSDRSEALKREAYIKGCSRKEKDILIRATSSIGRAIPS